MENKYEIDILDILISEERRQEIEKELEEEIFNLANKIICKKKFLFIIKKYSFRERCYLREKYIGNISLEEYKPPVPELTDEILITEEYIDEITYNSVINIPKYPIHTIRKINRIESMKSKKGINKKIRKR